MTSIRTIREKWEKSWKEVFPLTSQPASQSANQPTTIDEPKFNLHMKVASVAQCPSLCLVLLPYFYFHMHTHTNLHFQVSALLSVCFQVQAPKCASSDCCCCLASKTGKKKKCVCVTAKSRNGLARPCLACMFLHCCRDHLRPLPLPLPNQTAGKLKLGSSEWETCDSQLRERDEANSFIGKDNCKHTHRHTHSQPVWLSVSQSCLVESS